MKVKFWGVRGSVPVPGPDTVRVGGNTSCVEVRTADQEVLILDAGTGIRVLGLDLIRCCSNHVKAILLLSHTHWDHIQGLPFFAPARQPNNRLVIMGEHRVDRQLKQVLAGQMSYSYWPFGLEDLEANLSFKEVADSQEVIIGDHTTVLPQRVPHPGGVFGYRIGCQGKAVAYATDVNHPPRHLNARVIELARNADLLIHDAQFTPQEKDRLPDWGHSSWLEAIQVAREANARQLALFHHAPTRTDDELDEIEAEARSTFPGAFVAREGMEIVL